MIESFLDRLGQMEEKETKNTSIGTNASLYLLSLFFFFFSKALFNLEEIRLREWWSLEYVFIADKVSQGHKGQNATAAFVHRRLQKRGPGGGVREHVVPR